jgi:hypothetical protein
VNPDPNIEINDAPDAGITAEMRLLTTTGLAIGPEGIADEGLLSAPSPSRV